MPNIKLKSFPFDSMEVLNTESNQMEADRLYDAKIFRDYFRKFLSNGVYYGHYKNYGENSMKVILDSGLTVKVLKGAGIIEGVDYELESDKLITLERPSTGNRVDRIVVQMNASLDSRETNLYVKQGTGTTAATLQRDENIYEICIAEVTVKSTSNITNADIEDKRTDKNLCGVVNSLISIDGEAIYEQFQDYIDSIIDNLVLKNQENLTLKGKLTVLNKIEAEIDAKQLTNENLNNCRTTGFFYAQGGNTVTNKPQGIDNFGLICLRLGGNVYIQQLFSNLNYFRICSGGNTWTQWYKFYDERNPATTAEKLKNERLLNFTGAVQGSAYFDGTSNVNIDLQIKKGSTIPSRRK